CDGFEHGARSSMTGCDDLRDAAGAFYRERTVSVVTAGGRGGTWKDPSVRGNPVESRRGDSWRRGCTVRRPGMARQDQPSRARARQLSTRRKHMQRIVNGIGVLIPVVLLTAS